MTIIQKYYLQLSLGLSLFFILINNRSLDTYYFLSFFGVSIILVFNADPMPKTSLEEQGPQIHMYQKIRFNYYGLFLAFSLFLSSMIFFIISSFGGSLNFSTLIAFVLMNILYFYARKVILRNVFYSVITDYLSLNSKLERNIINSIVIVLLEIYQTNDNYEKAKTLLKSKFNTIDDDQLDALHYNLLIYLSKNSEEALPEEISD